MTFIVINQLGLVNHQHEDHFDSLTSGAKKIQNPKGEKAKRSQSTNSNLTCIIII